MSTARAVQPFRMRREQVLRAGAAFALLLLLWSFTPPAEPKFRLCGFYWLTARPCLLCGMTRAMFALAKGHLREALGFHLLSPLGFAMVFSLFWEHPWRSRLWRLGLPAYAVYGLVRILLPAI